MDGIFNSSMLGLITGLLSIFTTVFKSIAFVREGSRGVKLRFGKVVRDRNNNPIVIEPGFVWMIPFVESLVRRHVRQQTIRCENQMVMLEDGAVFFVSAIILFRVTDVYKALFEIEGIDHSLREICMASLRDELSARKHDEVHDTHKISEKLLDKVREQADQWGVEFIQFRLTNCSPEDDTAKLFLVDMMTRARSLALTNVAEQIGQLAIDPTLAAALIGIPVMASISHGPVIDIGSGAKHHETETEED